VFLLLLYILKRVFYSLLTLFVVITLTFFLMHAIPGGVYTSEKNLPAAIVNNIKAKYGLNLPLGDQYLIQLKNIAKLDFGMSMKNQGRNVNDIIRDQFPRSARLGAFAIALCLFVGIPLGILSALKVDKWQDRAAMIIATIGVSVPGFVIAILAQYFLGVKLGLFPTIGDKTFLHLVLPGIALSFFPLSFIARLVRSSMVEVLEQDYIRTARAKGLSERVVIYKHALKNSIMPVITYLGPLVASVLTGSFVIESVFNIPGIGRYFVTSITNRDYTVIIGVTVFFSLFLILMNLVVDIIYVVIDPRIKLNG
jgi:oligopeptide transport system permease protein